MSLDQAADVVAHRVRADGQTGCYGFVAQPVRQQSQHLRLAWCALDQLTPSLEILFFMKYRKMIPNNPATT
jgi:hypothetical protein